jgi:hypothetical protein
VRRPGRGRPLSPLRTNPRGFGSSNSRVANKPEVRGIEGGQ